MTRTALLAPLAVTLVLVACSGGGHRLSSSAQRATASRPADPDEPSEVAARLAGATYGRTPGAPTNCVPLAELGANRALSRDIVLFQGQAGRLYVTRVQNCPALQYGRALLLGPGGASLCSGEMAQVVDVGSRTSQGSCRVGQFLPYSPS